MASRVQYLSFDAIDSIPALALNLDGCWECDDYSDMYDAPPVLGEDRHIPGVAGRLAVAREEDEAVKSLPMKFMGIKDHSGAAHTDPRIGLRVNLDYFRTNIVRPLSGHTTRAVTFHLLDGSTTKTGNVIVEPPLQVAFQGPVLARGVLRIVIPAGMLA
jgi:hypothetical protein